MLARAIFSDTAMEIRFLPLPVPQVELKETTCEHVEQQRGSSAGSHTPPLGSPHPSYCGTSWAFCDALTLRSLNGTAVGRGRPACAMAEKVVRR